MLRIEKYKVKIFINNNNPVFAYIHGNLTAQRPVTKSARVCRTQNI
jgi:hypothetical protein